LNRSDTGQELEQEGDEIRRNGMFSCPPILLFFSEVGRLSLAAKSLNRSDMGSGEIEFSPGLLL